MKMLILYCLVAVAMVAVVSAMVIIRQQEREIATLKAQIVTLERHKAQLLEIAEDGGRNLVVLDAIWFGPQKPLPIPSK